VVLVVAVAVAIQISSLSTIYQERVLAGIGDQSVRMAGYTYLLDQASDDIGLLVFGGGYGHAQLVATQRGGIVAVYRTFDNQLIAWILDYGLLALVPALSALALALVRSENGRRAAPAVLAGLIMMQFANLMQFIPFAVVFGITLAMPGGSDGRRLDKEDNDVAPTISKPDRFGASNRQIHEAVRRRVKSGAGGY
jgi:hypothetical protein